MEPPWDSLTIPRTAFAYLARMISEYDVYQGKEEFEVEVLTPPEPINPQAAQAAGGSPDVASAAGKYIFCGRITNKGGPSPHINFVPDPCDLSVAPDKAGASQLMTLQTRYTINIEEDETLAAGDYIYSRTNPGDEEEFSPYDLQFGHLDRVAGKTRKRVTRVLSNICQSLEAAFEESDDVAELETPHHRGTAPPIS